MLHPELRQNRDWELCLSENCWVTYLHLSSAPGQPLLKRSEGLFHDEGSISAVKISRHQSEPCQTHVATSSGISKPNPWFPLCSSFLFSFSHSLSVCLYKMSHEVFVGMPVSPSFISQRERAMCHCFAKGGG